MVTRAPPSSRLSSAAIFRPSFASTRSQQSQTAPAPRSSRSRPWDRQYQTRCLSAASMAAAWNRSQSSAKAPHATATFVRRSGPAGAGARARGAGAGLAAGLAAGLRPMA